MYVALTADERVRIIGEENYHWVLFAYQESYGPYLTVESAEMAWKATVAAPLHSWEIGAPSCYF